MTTFYFNHEVGPKDWSALPCEFKIGDKIYEYTGYDYGVARDDRRYFGLEVVSCSLEDGQGPFFTVPRYMLTTTAPAKLTPGEHARNELKKLDDMTPANQRNRLYHHATIMKEHAKHRPNQFDRDVAAAMADIATVLGKLTLI